MQILEALDCGFGTVQECRVVKRVFGQQDFEVRFGCRVKMHAICVDVQAEGGVTVTSCQHGAQECVLNPNKVRRCSGCNRFAPVGGRTIAPNADKITVAWFAKGGIVARKRHNTSDTFLGQEPTVINVKPPQRCILCGGMSLFRHHV